MNCILGEHFNSILLEIRETITNIVYERHGFLVLAGFRRLDRNNRLVYRRNQLFLYQLIITFYKFHQNALHRLCSIIGQICDVSITLRMNHMKHPCQNDHNWYTSSYNGCTSFIRPKLWNLLTYLTGSTGSSYKCNSRHCKQANLSKLKNRNSSC